MNVLHVATSVDPEMGGVSKAIEMIIAGLKANGISSEVVTLDAPKAGFILSSSFLVYALGPGKSPWSYSSALVPWLRANLLRFDAIIIHGLWLYSSYSVGKALRNSRHTSSAINEADALNPKVFVMPHGMLDPYFQRAAGRKLKAYRNWIYWKLIERHTVNNADSLLFTCEEEKYLARQTFKPYVPKKELVVGLGIANPPLYTDVMRQAFLKKCNLIQNQPYILFISRIHEKKGVDLLIQAYSEVYAKWQSVEKTNNNEEDTIFLKLVIAGPGLDTHYGQQIQKMVTDNHSLKNLIYFTGMLTGDAKWGAFYGSEAFVLPSHQENFGIAVVEALACSKPVLISNQVNIWREIQNANGGLVADDTLEGTKKILQNWKELSLIKRSDMGKQAQYCYQKNFSIQAAATKMLAAISS
jgi:glycosyltransferase involved in cell wall biosynthesis